MSENTPAQDTRPPSPEIADEDMLTVCADGKVREIATTLYVSGEPERVRCTDGSEWITANCMKPQAQHRSPVPDTPVDRTPLEDAADVMLRMMGDVHDRGFVPSVELMRSALEPYFLKARRDALNEAHKAVSSDAGRRERRGFRDNSASALYAIRRVRDHG